MNIEELGYFLYMEEQERQQKEKEAAAAIEEEKVNVGFEKHLVAEKPTQNRYSR